MSFVNSAQIMQWKRLAEERDSKRYRDIHAQLVAGIKLTSKDRKWLIHWRMLVEDPEAPDSELLAAVERVIAARVTDKLLK